MNFLWSRYSLFFVFVSFLEIRFCKIHSFCELFAKNNFKISYPFRRIFADRSEIYLIINGYYWPLVFTDHKEDQNKTVKISESEISQSDLFAKPSSMAFCVWFQNSCKAGLLTIDKNFVEWAELERNGLNSVKILDQKAIRLQFKNIVTSFVAVWGQYDYRFVIFFRQIPRFEFEFHEIDSNLNLISKREENKHIIPKALYELIPGLQVIGILGQYSYMTYESRKGHSGNGMIILFQYDRSIKYCYTFVDKLSELCKKPRLLIDCSQPEFDTTPKQAADLDLNDSDNNMILVGIIAIACILMAGFVAGQWFLIGKKRNPDVDSDNDVSTYNTSTDATKGTGLRKQQTLN